MTPTLPLNLPLPLVSFILLLTSSKALPLTWMIVFGSSVKGEAEKEVAACVSEEQKASVAYCHLESVG